MKRSILALAALFSLFTLIESTHSHQFLHDDCCQSVCGGSIVANMGADADARIAPPSQPLVSAIPEAGPREAWLFETDIFHPPSLS